MQILIIEFYIFFLKKKDVKIHAVTRKTENILLCFKKRFRNSALFHLDIDIAIQLLEDYSCYDGKNNNLHFFFISYKKVCFVTQNMRPYVVVPAKEAFLNLFYELINATTTKKDNVIKILPL